MATAEEIIDAYPKLFHMAAGGSWNSIKQNGLLSTANLCEFFGVPPEAQTQIVEMHRPESILIEQAQLGTALIRDQKPMSISGLQRALTDMTPTEWLISLNQKVFFWPTEERLKRLICAGPYKDKTHDVLIVDTRKILTDNHERMWLCHINSGCTRPFPWPRGTDTFKRLSDYPFESRRRKYGVNNAVAEVAFDGAITNIADSVLEVVSSSCSSWS